MRALPLSLRVMATISRDSAPRHRIELSSHKLAISRSSIGGTAFEATLVIDVAMSLLGRRRNSESYLSLV
jgi:hypothetical protein